MKREQPAELIECHALAGEHLARQHRVRALVENVVLGKDMVGLIFRAGRGRHAGCIENHDDARDAAIGLRLLRHEIVGDPKIGGECAAFEKIPLAFAGIQVRQIAGQRQGFGMRDGSVCDWSEQAERERQKRQQAAGYFHLSIPVLTSGQICNGRGLPARPAVPSGGFHFTSLTATTSISTRNPGLARAATPTTARAGRFG